jgi:glycosyltransferase involved in cell wall biosynthesis
MEVDVLQQSGVATPQPGVSVVIPLFNEEDNILPLYRALKPVMEELGRRWEIIFVDDGSNDTTYQTLKQIHLRDDNVRVLRLRRNFGQTAALAAGFDYASEGIIIALDGDLQNDPKDIPLLIEKLDEGYDVVSGWRVNRQDPFLRRRLPSQIANWLISFITGVHLHDYGCTLKALRHEIAKEIKLYGEMHRFIPALAADLGAKIIEVPVSHHARQHGRSKYGISRILRVILDLITVKFLSKYSTRPSHIFGLCGLIAMLSGLGICGVLGVQRLLFHMDLAGRPLLLFGVLLLIVGVQFITMGLLGELLSRAYHEGQGKPIYVMKEILDSSHDGVRDGQESDSQADGMFSADQVSENRAHKNA